MRRHDARGVLADRVAAVPRHAVADAAQPAAAGGDLGFQHLAHAGADGQVGAADDRLGDAARAVIAGRAHRGDAVDELDLAQRRHLARAVLAIHRAAFEEHGRDDVVAAADVGQQFGQQVAAALRRVPEMVVRIDDRQVRLQRRLARPLRQPCLQVGVVAIGQAGYSPLESPDISIPFVTVLCAAPHAVCAVIGQPNRVIRRHEHAVCAGNDPFPHQRGKMPSRSNKIIGCSPRLNAWTGARSSPLTGSSPCSDSRWPAHTPGWRSCAAPT